MRRFGYLRDPLFLVSCGLYALNRWIVKPSVPAAFWHNWFADVLLIPCALPPLLWFHRRCHLRFSDLPPTAGEITTHFLGGSILFEVIGPHLTARSTGDWHDVLAYGAGAVLAFVWWHRPALSSVPPSAHEF